ncbi:MAG TPA: DUF4153 domain-containing protein [Bacteroidales bacterium]|nr:DUF4153 domain-containing protein [Bacteroidales bacterium]HOX73081.1 DUF4153 domain-containing protein [Bacteroidales bacterium]HPM86393.1 DUF4153 domain-containing protein [Bacteroidales bacterium]HQM69695.1 DUF4153 domain-containing protein [Bacteroidales bacterium]
MRDEIKTNLGNPEILEKLYRKDRKAFKAAFESIYTEIESTDAVKFWKIRLDYDIRPDTPKTFTLTELITVFVFCVIVVFLVKIPSIFNLSFPEDIFYMRNTAIIVFFGLTLYTVWFNRIKDIKKLIMTAMAFLIAAIYINLLPSDSQGAAVILVYIHLPFLMWFIYGIVFTGYEFRNLDKRIDFIRFNGDLVIFYALIAIAGGLLTAITVGLFDSIGLDIEKFYGENIIITGAAAAPVVAAFLIEKFPALVSRTAPLIATIFSPLVLITLIVFLVTILVTGKDPYNDRDFLLVFNIMLLGVMAIIIFSVSETSVIKNQKFNAIILFVLSTVTIIIDLIALSAIFYRLGEYGLTPNRLAVLVSNILVLINLVLIMAGLFRINFKKKDFTIVEKTVSKFLPVYLAWILIVIFAFPAIFGLR